MQGWESAICTLSVRRLQLHTTNLYHERRERKTGAKWDLVASGGHDNGKPYRDNR